MFMQSLKRKNAAFVISATLLTVISVGLVQAGALRPLARYLSVQASIQGVLVAGGGFPDCNGNGVDDSLDIANLTSSDCDSNGVPDECQIIVSSGAAGGPYFCIADCDPDCNGTGIPDACELAANDCNADGRPDECGVLIDCLNPPTLIEGQRITAPSEAGGDLFGTSISVDGDLAVVGAYLDDLVGCTDCGSAYVYRFDGSAWLLETQLIASDGTPDGEFGGSVSISGNKIVVGASGAGCAAGLYCGATYVYRFDGAQWIEEEKLVALDEANFDRFGESVSIHADVILVGAQRANCTAGVDCGAAYVFRYDDTISSWMEEAKLVASDAAGNDQFGSSAALHGDTAVIGAPSADCLAGDDCGAAYVFRYDDTIPEWVEEAKITASDALERDTFGESVSIDLNKIIIGAPHVNCPDGGAYCGVAYVNRYDDTMPGWVEEAKLTANRSGEFGASVSIEGNTVAVGEPALFTPTGRAYVYRYNIGTQVWDLHLKLRGGDGFGRSISVSGDTVIVGAEFVDCAAGGACGAVYAFDSSGSDCNCDGTADFCDIRDCLGDPACADCNNNGLPDECELSTNDCNGNETPDDCDIDSGTSNDCNGNGIPDECDPLGDDCNGNLIMDECDTDCNLNGVPDDCEVADGTSPDCQPNGIPDECELEGSFLDVSPKLSPFTFENPQSHTIPSPPFAFSDVTMSFEARAQLTNPSEAINVHINGTFVGTVFNVESTSCQSPAGTDQLVLPAATFNAATNGGDALIGLIITAEFGGRCAPTLISVTTSYDGGQDCNTNGAPDSCDIADGTSQDGDEDGVPDECKFRPTRAPPPHHILKNRYISIDPSGEYGNNPSSHHIRVLVDSTQVTGLNGAGPWWATAPVNGQPPSPANCISVVSAIKPASEPDWTGCPTLHLTGCPIVPTTTYAIQAEVAGFLSAEVLLDTQARPGAKWIGDCVGNYIVNAGEWSGPNGTVNADDFLAAIMTFQNANGFNATHLSVTDMEPSLNGEQINLQVNINDVFFIIKGFQGIQYNEFEGGPDLTQCP